MQESGRREVAERVFLARAVTFSCWLQSCLSQSQGRQSLVGCHLWGRTELDKPAPGTRVSANLRHGLRGVPSARAHACSQPPRPLPCAGTWYSRGGGWRPPRLQPGAGFSNLSFGVVPAALAVTLEMEGHVLKGHELRAAGPGAQQVSEGGARLQVLKL